MLMTTAPKDGTRILALCEEYHYTRREGWHVAGKVIKEIWWKQFSPYEDARWCAYCGTEETQSTEAIHPVKWIPVPDELRS